MRLSAVREKVRVVLLRFQNDVSRTVLDDEVSNNSIIPVREKAVEEVISLVLNNPAVEIERELVRWLKEQGVYGKSNSGVIGDVKLAFEALSRTLSDRLKEEGK